MSKGNIIFLLDSDDIFKKNKLSEINKIFKKNKKINFIQDTPINSFLKKKMSLKKKNHFFSIWPSFFPTSCIAFKRNFFNIGLRNKKSFDLKFLGYNHKKEFINFRSNDSIDFNSNTYILKLSQFNIVNSQIFLYGMYQNQKGQESLNLYNRDKISENRELGFELFKHVKNADLRISSQTSFINFDWNIDSESVSTERQNSVLTGSFELNKPDKEDVLFLKDIKLVLSNHRITDKSDTLKGINLPYHYWENNNFNFTMSFLKKTNQKRAFYYLNFSKTYRPPSLYDFLSNSTFNLYENQLDLEPEHKSTYEIGYRLNRVAVIGEASYDLNTSFFNYSYLNKMKNIIVEGTPAQFTVNSGAASIFGLDVKLELSPTVSWINLYICSVWCHGVLGKLIYD